MIRLFRAGSLVVAVAGLVVGPAVRATVFDHRLLDEVLTAHVQSGLVNYAALKGDSRLNEYLKQLSQADPAALDTRNQQLAFWINAYNAYTLKLVADHYPLKSVRDIKIPGAETPFAAPIAIIGGKPLTLDHIEHEILRKQLREPRIHFALVCAARSCPQLRSEAYAPERLDQQLETQGRWFVVWRNQFDTEKKTAGLSPILQWFAEDFGGSREATLKFIAPYTIESVRNSIEKDSGSWQVRFLNYDWALNEQTLK